MLFLHIKLEQTGIHLYIYFQQLYKVATNRSLCTSPSPLLSAPTAATASSAACEEK